MIPRRRLATAAGDQGTPQFLQLVREWEELGEEREASARKLDLVAADPVRLLGPEEEGR